MSLFQDPLLRAVAMHLWQASLFGLVVAAWILTVPGMSARARHALAGLALARFFVPTHAFAWLAGVVQAAFPHAGWLGLRFHEVWMPPFLVAGQGTVGLTQGPPLGLRLLAAAWFAGVAVVAGASFLRLVRGLRAVRERRVPFTPAEQRRLDDLAVRAGLPRGRVAGFTVRNGAWLGVVGVFRSRVLVPEGLFSTLDDAETDAVLLHELMHVRRRDNLVRLLQACAVALLWFHPLVWWLDRRLCWESERACDDGVLRVTGANDVYANGLYKAARYALGLTLPGVSGMSRLRLRTRIQAVLNHQPQKDSSMKFVFLVGSVLGLVGAATLMAAGENSGRETAANAVASEGAVPRVTEEVLPVEGLSQVPTLRNAERPLYPKELKEQGRTGKVIIEVIVDKDGSVQSAVVKQSTDHAFDASALTAVRHWTFNPGLKDGRPVNVRLAVPIVYSLPK